MEKLEAKALRKGPLSEPKPVPDQSSERPSLRDLITDKSILRVVSIISIGFFGATLGYYLFANWALYSLVEGLHYSEEKAYGIQMIWNVVYCVTPFVTFFIMDLFERKNLMFITAVISAITLVFLGTSPDDWMVIVSGGAAAIITGIVINVYYTYIPEAIPLKFRGLGTGVILSAGRTGGAVSGVLGAALFSQGGIEGGYDRGRGFLCAVLGYRSSSWSTNHEAIIGGDFGGGGYRELDSLSHSQSCEPPVAKRAAFLVDATRGVK